MKKIYILFAFIFLGKIIVAQDIQPRNDPQKSQQIEALKVAFISKELELTQDEAQKFWPVYNQCSNEIKYVIKFSTDPLDKDEKILNIKKHYKEPFVRIIGPERTNRLYNIEGKFRELLIKRLRNQNNNYHENPDGSRMQRRHSGDF